MADKETTTPSAAAVITSSTTSLGARRVGTSSPPPKDDVTSTPAETPAAPTIITEPLLEDDDQLQAENVSDSGFDSASERSNTTSITSSIYQGYIENGRRYQTTREGEYLVPSDEKQFEALQSAHLMHVILESQQENPFFCSPLSDSVHNVLDIGTGNGAWACDVADKFPGALVQGIDLYPPPDTWVPPNCKFIVDDVVKPWMFTQKFDLIHIRWLYGALTERQFDLLYKQAYDNLEPGGWIEQVEPDIIFRCDDGTMPADSLIASWSQMFIDICRPTGKPLDYANTFKSRIEAHGGFQNIHEKVYKVPYGNWTKNKMLKEAGIINKKHFLQGMEGYAMFALTKLGKPEPWSPEEVQVYLAKVRKEMSMGWHTYYEIRRVWAQKPYAAESGAKNEGNKLGDASVKFQDL